MDKEQVRQMMYEMEDKLFNYAVNTDDIESISITNARMGEDGFKATITVKEVLSEDKKKEIFHNKATRVSLPKELYNLSFESSGEDFKIIDINTNAPKYPIVAENLQGEQYRFSREMADYLMSQRK